MEIKLNGTTIVPPNTTPRGAMTILNMHIFSLASEYADVNLGKLAKIHHRKITLWKMGKMLLMIDELDRIAKLLNIKLEIDE